MAPFRVEDETMCQNLKKRPAIRETLDIAENATIMITGIGCEAQKGYLAEVEDSFLKNGAVGYIAGYYFDRYGNIIDLPHLYNRLVCADRRMFEIPTRCAIVADERKAMATLAALRGGLINTLITNTVVANKILALYSKER